MSADVALVSAAVAVPRGDFFSVEWRYLVEQHNLFRTGDGHIHALWFNFESGWHHEDRNPKSVAPPARDATEE